MAREQSQGYGLFEQAVDLNLSHAKIAAFGSTRRANTLVMKMLRLNCSSMRTLRRNHFGKSWLLHVTDVLRTTPEENLQMIEDTVRYLKEMGKEVVYDAEHFLTDLRITQNMPYPP